MKAIFKTEGKDIQVSIPQMELGSSLIVDILEGRSISIPVTRGDILDSIKRLFVNVKIECLMKGHEVGKYKIISESTGNNYLVYIGFLIEQPITVQPTGMGENDQRIVPMSQIG